MDPKPGGAQDTAAVGGSQRPAKQVPVRWANADAPILFANIAFGIVDDLGDIVVSLGRVEPAPITSNDPEERSRQIEAIDHVDGHILFRFSASPQRLRLMIEQLEEALSTRDNWRREVLRQGADSA